MTNLDQNNSNREIRVFISSTFRDMHAERNYLISHVFPFIRRVCRERQVEFTEIDLRWGVTKEEAEQGKVVRICLEEINRCRPYFLSLLGDRYGWAPIDTDLEHKAELLNLFPFLADSLKAGLSVTEMEIMHGVLDNPAMAEHCFFYLRDSALSQSLAESYNTQNNYFEIEEDLKDKLNALKDKVRRSGLPVRDNYISVEAVGESIKRDLLSILDKQFPEDKTPTSLEAEQNAHRSYARDRCQAYIANPIDIKALDEHFSIPTNNALLITGESGLGKSALLAYWISKQRINFPNQFIIEHYVGISGDANPVAIIRRIMKEIRYRIGDNSDIPLKSEDIIKEFPLWLAKIGRDDPLILIIDGLNQLEIGDEKWLPSFWQENVKAIFSVIPGIQLNKLQKYGWPNYILETLDLKRREQLIQEWLANYRKKLSTEQTQRISNAVQSGNPLFLKTLLEELRIFGYFEYLDQRITSLLTANNPQELFIIVLERIESDFGKDIVIQIMQALWASKRGLSETEITAITGLNRLVISTFLMSIDAHLSKRSGLLIFFHNYLRQATTSRYLNCLDIQKNAHLKLADYFQKIEFTDRVADELPWQLQVAGEIESLLNCITSIPNFLLLINRKEFELMEYIISIQRLRLDYVNEIKKNLKKWEEDEIIDEMKIAEVYFQISDFIFVSTEYFDSRVRELRVAINIAVKAVQIYENIFDDNNTELMPVLLKVGKLYLIRGFEDDAYTAETYARDALKIAQKNYDQTDNELTEPLLLLGAALRIQALNEKKLKNEKHKEILKESMDCFEKAYEIRKNKKGKNHISIADLYGEIAKTCYSQGSYELAITNIRKKLNIQKTNSINEIQLSKTKIQLANYVMSINKDLYEAKKLYEEVLSVYKKHYGRRCERNIYIMGTIYCLVDIYRDIGDNTSIANLYKWEKYGDGAIDLEGLIDYVITSKKNKAEKDKNEILKSTELDELFKIEIKRLEINYGNGSFELILQLNYYLIYLKKNNREYEATIVLDKILKEINFLKYEFRQGVVLCLKETALNMISQDREIILAINYLKIAEKIHRKITPETDDDYSKYWLIIGNFLYKLDEKESSKDYYKDAIKFHRELNLYVQKQEEIEKLREDALNEELLKN